jgi:acyl-CoA thioester hydrolase
MQQAGVYEGMQRNFQHVLRVRYGECDPQGIVFNANYLLYVDVAFTELWREAIGPWMEMGERGYDAVVNECRLRFRAPARFDDEIAVAMNVTRLGRSSIETAVEIRRGDELLVEASLRHTVVSTETWRSAEMPAWIRDGLAPYSSGGS